MKEVYIVESALFSAGRPLSAEEISEATDMPLKAVRGYLKKLVGMYSDREGSLEVSRVGDRYAMQLKPEYAEHARQLAQMEIPLKVLKTAALIAYHQPIKQSDLKNMIGEKAYDHVAELKDLGLIRLRAFERTKMISTTERFAEYFGIDSQKSDYIKEWLLKKVGKSAIKKGEKIVDYDRGPQGDGSNVSEEPTDNEDDDTRDDDRDDTRDDDRDDTRDDDRDDTRDDDRDDTVAEEVDNDGPDMDGDPDDPAAEGPTGEDDDPDDPAAEGPTGEDGDPDDPAAEGPTGEDDDPDDPATEGPTGEDDDSVNSAIVDD